jgi:DNA-binding NarL/FixJ family response regulator
MNPPVAVAVFANDQITREGAVARLSAYRELAVLSVGQHHRARVLLMLADELSEGALSTMERVRREAASRPGTVLVANELGQEQLARAVDLGLVSVLHRRHSGYDRIVRAILAAVTARAEAPDAVLRSALETFTALDSRAPRQTGGLADREIDVLRLVADGLDTSEIAGKLNYSERTVKNVVHGVVTRLHLRNRAQAVAYAVRVGAI